MTIKNKNLEMGSDDSNLQYSHESKSMTNDNNTNRIADDSVLSSSSRLDKQSLETDFLPLSSICSVCRKVTTFRCRKCNSTFYCSRLCQRKAWGVHKLVCGMDQRQIGDDNMIITEHVDIYSPPLSSSSTTGVDSGVSDDDTIADLNITNASINNSSIYTLQNPLVINKIVTPGVNNTSSNNIVASKRSLAETNGIPYAIGNAINASPSSSSSLFNSTSSNGNDDDTNNASSNSARYKFNFYDETANASISDFISGDSNNNNNRSAKFSKGFNISSSSSSKIKSTTTPLYGIQEGNAYYCSTRGNNDYGGDDQADDDIVTSTTAVMDMEPSSSSSSAMNASLFEFFKNKNNHSGFSQQTAAVADAKQNEGVATLISLLGVSEAAARSAMQWYNNNVDDAASYLMSSNNFDNNNHLTSDSSSSSNKSKTSSSSVINTPSQSSLMGQLQQHKEQVTAASATAITRNASSLSSSIEWDPSYIKQQLQHQQHPLRGSLFINRPSSITTIATGNSKDEEMGLMIGSSSSSATSHAPSSSESTATFISTVQPTLTLPSPPSLMWQPESFHADRDSYYDNKYTAAAVTSSTVRPPLVPLFYDNDNDDPMMMTTCARESTSAVTSTDGDDNNSNNITTNSKKSVGFITPPRNNHHNQNNSDGSSNNNNNNTSYSSHNDGGGGGGMKPRAYPFSVDSNNANDTTTTTAVRESFSAAASTLKNDLALRVSTKRQENAMMLCECLGFISLETALRALDCCDGDTDRAAEWVLAGNM